MGPIAVNDFELALHLWDNNDPAMAKVIKGADDMPVLLAYLATLTSGTDLPNEALLESALPFAVASLRVESDAAKLWNQELQKGVDRLLPLARTGQKFTKGRKPAALGPVAKKIKAYLQKNPAAKTLDVWRALKKSPPNGFVFMESARLGRYIEKGCETVMEWRRFQNLVSEHRPKS